jgi:glycosyltransferase involved in cell wall biosynthesis
MNSKKPLVSVIIPCYRQAHYLHDALDSVLHQTYENIETIVIDDGSPDRVKEVTEQYSHVKYYRQENMGLAEARNTGLKLSLADFILFLDADDRLLPSGIETNLSWLRSHSEYHCVTGQCVLIDSDGNPRKGCPPPLPVRATYDAFLRTNLIWNPGAVLYHRDLLSEIGGFDPTIDATADWDVYLRIAKSTCIGTHNVPVVEYRLHDKNMSGNPATMLQHTLTLFRKHAAYVKGNKAREEAYRAGRNHCRSAYSERLLNYIGHMIITKREWRKIICGIFILLRFNPGILTYLPFKKAIAALLIRFSLLTKQENPHY